MISPIDLIGQKFGRLTVLEKSQTKRKWICRCDCGNILEAYGYDIKSGHTKSCGCYRREKLKDLYTTHNHSQCRNGKPHKLYQVWHSMTQRCCNSNSAPYDRYGGRGIRVCQRWLKYENFLEDMGKDWEEGLTIERIDNDGNYEPSNCKWVTQKQQTRNTSRNKYITYKGETKSLGEWVEILGQPYNRIYKRLLRGASIDEAFKDVQNENN